MHQTLQSEMIVQNRVTFVVTILLFLSLLLLLPLGVLSHRTSRPFDPCNPSNELDQRALRADQITVLINGYSESRIPLLQTIAATYSASPLVSSVLILWGNPSTPVQTLAHLAKNLSLSSFGSATISLVRQPSSSLNLRFLPRSSIHTQAVLICDDDVEVDPKSFEFAFKIWRLNPDRLVGFFVRSHDLDLFARKWIYTVHPNKYSIMLTKFMILKNQYLYEYSCKGGSKMAEMRKIVGRMQNCEDILMNFVVADNVNIGPILVGAERVRDWGDARNEDNNGQFGFEDGEGSTVQAVGLSSRVGEHRKRRGECITEFHKLLGRMPLRYNYGKVVNSVGEQGLCMKGGKLVFCDRYR
ncbi:glycosyltransferase family protein 64 C3 [Mercurialis annua]|uniref:glycosyltransferase family protein 64 C3 n=1 Tax=Mercurialis annua TaxID=3986 RepID=UPI00215E598E|nr:glycosyltransferase family protein 64 C3 [Mercurialis annua]